MLSQSSSFTSWKPYWIIRSRSGRYVAQSTSNPSAASVVFASRARLRGSPCSCVTCRIALRGISFPVTFRKSAVTLCFPLEGERTDSRVSSSRSNRKFRGIATSRSNQRICRFPAADTFRFPSWFVPVVRTSSVMRNSPALTVPLVSLPATSRQIWSTASLGIIQLPERENLVSTSYPAIRLSRMAPRGRASLLRRTISTFVPMYVFSVFSSCSIR